MKKNPNENNASLLRRFQRRIQEGNVIRSIKSKRYSERAQSKLSQKKRALTRIDRRKVNDHLKKMGKIAS